MPQKQNWGDVLIFGRAVFGPRMLESARLVYSHPSLQEETLRCHFCWLQLPSPPRTSELVPSMADSDLALPRPQ